MEHDLGAAHRTLDLSPEARPRRETPVTASEYRRECLPVLAEARRREARAKPGGTAEASLPSLQTGRMGIFYTHFYRKQKRSCMT